MRVALISANKETLPDPVFPLGLSYVAQALRTAGHDVHILDLFFASDIEGAVSEMVKTFEPQLVGVSFRNIDDASYPKTTSYLAVYDQVIRAVKGSTSAPILAGGAGFTIMPGEFLKTFKGIDYGAVGEGEGAAVELAGLLEKGPVAPSDLPDGVVCKARPTTRPRRNPRWSVLRPGRDLFDVSAYYDRGGMLNVQMKRGCPFKCTYCTYPMVEGRRPRCRPPKEVVDELEQVTAETGVTHFFVVDSVFNHPREQAVEFCEEIIKRKLDVTWTCYANAGLMDGELIEKMRMAGCEGVEFGTDALVDEILENLGKGFTFEQIKEGARLCHELDLRFCHFVFVGSPGEGPDEVKLGLDRLASLNPDATFVMTGIRIFPGTKLAERAREELGITKVGIEPIHYVSPKVIAHMDSIAETIATEHPSWVIPGFERNFSERIQLVIRRSGKKGVLWDFLSSR